MKYSLFNFDLDFIIHVGWCISALCIFAKNSMLDSGLLSAVSIVMPRAVEIQMFFLVLINISTPFVNFDLDLIIQVELCISALCILAKNSMLDSGLLSAVSIVKPRVHSGLDNISFIL